MEELSGDEVLVLIVSLLTAMVGAVIWYGPLFRIPRLNPQLRRRATLALMPAICLLLLGQLIHRWGDPQVRDNPLYITLFVLVGAAGLALLVIVLPLLGISPRDDAIERNNPAAGGMICGAMGGITFCFAGANAGTGATIWSTILPAAMAVGTLLLLWLVFEWLTHVTESITIERDKSSGLRAGGLLMAQGLILGRAVAGNYHDAESTIRDFLALGSPALLLLAVAVTIQYIARPTVDRPQPNYERWGVWATAIYLILATTYVVRLGPWEGMVMQ